MGGGRVTEEGVRIRKDIDFARRGLVGSTAPILRNVRISPMSYNRT